MNDRGYTRSKRLMTTQRLQCMKSGVLLQARLQYCDAMLQYSCASCSEQIAIALTSCRSTVKVLFNVYCKFKVNLFHKPVIYVYIFQIILNVFSPVRRWNASLFTITRQIYIKYPQNCYFFQNLYTFLTKKLQIYF